MQFAHPTCLILLLLVPLPLWLERDRRRIVWPSLTSFPSDRRVSTWRRRLRFLPPLLRGLAIGALAVALARPRTVGGVTRITGQGVAIVVALDQSSSMNSVDFVADRQTRKISRLEAAKETLIRFVQGRPDDLIGLIAFANYPDLAYAPTLDHERLIETARLIRTASPGDDGTNIGFAIDWSSGALRDTAPAKKVLILLTDGNNEPAGPRPRDPEQAAALARDLGITIHTIAVGRPGGIVRETDPDSGLPVISEVEGPNLELLERISSTAGGRAFVATSADALHEVFQTINTLEKSVVSSEILTRYDEHFAPWAALALGLLILDRLLQNAWLRRLP